MPEVQTRISQIREAADQMSKSSQRLDESLEQVRLTVQYLYTMGYQGQGAAGLFALYQDSTARMEEWIALLRNFSGSLAQAADDIERAAGTNSPPPVVEAAPADFSYIPPSIDWTVRRGAINSSLESTPPPIPLPVTYDYGSYVSPINKPLYDQLVASQQSLSEQEARLAVLMDTRQKLADDLVALQNRLLSFNPNANLATVPRVVALQNQLASYDLDIIGTQTRIDNLRAGVQELITRLDRVKPGAGADLLTIVGMEKATTAPYVLAHTQDCVHYIATKIAIPDGIAQDAYLWDDKALALPQYGITVGTTPLTGSVIVMEQTHSYANPISGHLMYVEGVSGDQVWVTDNTHPTPVLLSDLTSEVSGENIKYLYFPWSTKA